MPVSYSTAKIYKNFARNLVMEVCFRDIFHRNLDHLSVRKSFRGTIDFDSDYLTRIFFTCNGVDYTIRLWNITPSPSGNRNKIEWSAYGWYKCNDCDKEFGRDIPNNDFTRCDECAKRISDSNDD